MRSLIPILMFIPLLAACARTPASDNPERPVSNQDNAQPLAPEYAPQPGDGALVRGNIYLDPVQLVTMESFPLQFSLYLTGSLPTPCHALRLIVLPPDDQNRILIEAYSVTDPDQICIQVLEPFDASLPLGSFPDGHYTVWINAEKVAEFDA
ncbi:MAG: hypothetical protein JXB85_10095 [Anaerolineales bacterium]|nr:hypothetical protein [Anaerolineales bacterium]